MNVRLASQGKSAGPVRNQKMLPSVPSALLGGGLFLIGRPGLRTIEKQVSYC
jgi:hypothetical protein